MQNLSKVELRLIAAIKARGAVVVSQMSDPRQKALFRLCERGFCRWELVENTKTGRNEIHYTLE